MSGKTFVSVTPRSEEAKSGLEKVFFQLQRYKRNMVVVSCTAQQQTSFSRPVFTPSIALPLPPVQIKIVDLSFSSYSSFVFCFTNSTWGKDL